MNRYLYRVQVIEYPGESWIETEHGSYPNPDWQPEGWAPDEEWIERFGHVTGARFFWPTTEKEWKSRSSAARRKNLIESYGATCIIQRSAPIAWPADGEAYVPTRKQAADAFITELLEKKRGGAS